MAPYYFALPGAGLFYFFSSWLLMIFAGILADDIGIEPFGYVTSLVATIGLWLVLAPAVSSIAAARSKSKKTYGTGM